MVEKQQQSGIYIRCSKINNTIGGAKSYITFCLLLISK